MGHRNGYSDENHKEKYSNTYDNNFHSKNIRLAFGLQAAWKKNQTHHPYCRKLDCLFKWRKYSVY